MTMEKRGVIEDGRTPREILDEAEAELKKAAGIDKFDHPTSRAADAAADSIRGNGNQDSK